MVDLNKADYPILSRELVYTYNEIQYRATIYKWGKVKIVAANLEIGNYILSLAQADTDCCGDCDRCMQPLVANNINVTSGRYHHIDCGRAIKPEVPKMHL